MNCNKSSANRRFFRALKRSRMVFAIFVTCLYPLSAAAFDILLGTGEAGSFSHFAGRTICRIVNSGDADLQCKAVPTSGGDVHNLTNLRGGSLDICLVDSRMLSDAIKKQGSFRFLDIGYENLREVVPLYEIPITMVVRKDADIDSLEAVKGKRINAGAPLSVQKRATETVLAAKKWSYGDFSLAQELPSSLSQDTMAFCHGAIQAMFHVGVHPDSGLRQLIELCDAGLVGVHDADIEKWIQENPAFCKTRVGAAYPQIAGQIDTLGTRGVLVASDILDESAVYRILGAIYSGRDRLKRAHPSIDPPPADKISRGDAVKPHPGAVKFFSLPAP